MPSSSEILVGLTFIANTWSAAAIAWHITIAASLAALVAGWRPAQRQSSLLLTVPLVSASVVAWAAGNPFNGTLLAVGAVVLATIGARLADAPVRRSSNAASLVGLAMIAFGGVYPHFLEEGSAVRYLYAAPLGLVPCPTLSVAIGFALLADGFASRAWSLILATMGLFYGPFGVFRLGVTLDVGLIAGALTLATVALRLAPRHGRTDSPTAAANR